MLEPGLDARNPAGYRQFCFSSMHSSPQPSQPSLTAPLGVSLTPGAPRCPVVHHLPCRHGLVCLPALENRAITITTTTRRHTTSRRHVPEQLPTDAPAPHPVGGAPRHVCTRQPAELHYWHLRWQGKMLLLTLPNVSRRPGGASVSTVVMTLEEAAACPPDFPAWEASALSWPSSCPT